MGAEIKQTLERNFDMVLSVGEIRNLTMGKLLELQGGACASSSTVSKNDLDADIIQIKQQVISFESYSLPPECCFCYNGRIQDRVVQVAIMVEYKTV